MANWAEGDVRANGITIHYYRTDGADRRSIVLLHGVTDDALCWSRVAHALEESYDVVMTDARGHGRSEGLATGFSVSILADDAAGVIRALDLDQPYLFGHSMGAITAAVLAARYPDLVRALVLEDPPLRDEPPERTADGGAQAAAQRWDALAALRRLPREERIAQGRASQPAWAEEEIVPWADSKAAFDPGVVDALKQGTAFAVPWREVLARITCPILLLTGDPELGALVTPAVAREAEGLWQEGEVAHIAGAGHNIRRDRFEETIERVRTFLQQH